MSCIVVIYSTVALCWEADMTYPLIREILASLIQSRITTLRTMNGTSRAPSMLELPKELESSPLP
jgi:hypothetical protein